MRLERDGALASWAVPKGMPLEPGQQHLAVHVEDHPLEYGAFEGEIPKGEYGAGTVEVWDRGTYELLEEKKNGGLTFRLDGERLQGTWALIPAHLSGQEKNWLVLRKREEAAKPSPAQTGRYRPMLATPVKELPRGDGWLFEPKWDGYRALAYIRGGEVELQSRTGKSDLTTRFDTIARALPRAVRTPDCVLDGEVCAIDDTGRASFSAMQQGSGTLVYYVFDLLEQDGELLVDLPLTERRRRLKKLLGRSQSVAFTDTFDDGDALLDAAAQQGPGGRHGEARGLPLRAGPVAPMAEGEGAPASGARRSRLHEGPKEARTHGRARARCPRAGRPALGRQRWHRLHGG